MQIQTVVVIGAGASGLQSARALLKRGRSQVLILEQGGAVGGVWTKPYLASVQVPPAFYEFAEFPWPAHLVQDAKGHPSSQAVQAYIQAYAEHFGLIQHIRFHCQLLRLQQAPEGGWAVIYLDQASGLFQVVAADYVVVATGIYCVPNVPVYKGMQHFHGLQLHANDLMDPALLAGKRVVVVGSGRSALDYASMVAASKQAAKVTWLFRQAHWPIPQHIATGLPLQRFLFSRLPSVLLPPYYTATASQQGMHRLSVPLKSSVWKWLQSSIVQQFNLKGGMLPALSLQQDLLFYGLVVNAEWNKVLHQGQAGTLKRSCRTDSSSENRCFVQLLQQESRLSCGGGGGYSSRRLSSKRSTVSCAGSSIEGNSCRPDRFMQCEQLNRSKSCWWGKLRSRKHFGRTASAGPNSSAPVDQTQQQQSSSFQPPATGIAGGMGSSMKLKADLTGSGSGEIQGMCGEIERFGRDCLLLRSGGAVLADVVLYCTGYNKSYDYLDSEPRGRLGLQKDGLPLYRHILPPLVPGLAFIGCEASSYNTLLTAGLQAEWLAAVLDGQAVLPEVEPMQEDVRRMTAWMRNVFPAHRHRASAVQLYMAHYHAQLLQDMQLQPPSHPWLLQPLTARDYSFAFRLPFGMPVQGKCDSHVQHEECEGGMDSVAAATEQAQRTQQSFTAMQLSSAAAVAVAMAPTGLAGGLLQRSRTDSPAGDSAVETSPADMGPELQEKQQWQAQGASCTSTVDNVSSAFREQSVVMAAAMRVDDNGAAGAHSVLEAAAAPTTKQWEQQSTQEAQLRSRSATLTEAGPMQHPVEWCQQLQQQEEQEPQLEGMPVSSSMNASIQACADSTGIWSGSNAWFSPCSHAYNAAESTAEVEQESMGTFGEGFTAGMEEASCTARVLLTSTFDSSSSSVRCCSDSMGGADSAAIAAAAPQGGKHRRQAQLQQHRLLASHLQPPTVEAAAAAAEVSSSMGLSPAAALSGTAVVSAPSTPKLLQGMASLPADGSSRTSLPAATEYGTSATSKHYDMLHRSSSSGCTASRRVSATCSGFRRSSSLAAPIAAAAAAVSGGVGSFSIQQRLLQQRSRSCGSCAAAESAIEETVELTEQTIEQQEREGDDGGPLVLPGASRQASGAVQRWLDSLPPTVTGGVVDDPDYFECRPQQARRHSSAQSLCSSHRISNVSQEQQQQRLVGDESRSAGKCSAYLLPTPFVADVLGGCGAAAPGSRQRSQRGSLCTPDSRQEQHSPVPSSSWDQVEAAVAEWRQQEQEAEQQQQQLMKRQGSLAKQVLQRTAAAASASRTYSCPNKLPSNARAMSLNLDKGSFSLVGGGVPTAMQRQRGKTPISSPTPVLHTAGPTPSMSRTASSSASPAVLMTVPCCGSCSASPVVVSCTACGCMSASALPVANPAAPLASPVQGSLDGAGSGMRVGTAGSSIPQSTPMQTEGKGPATPQLFNSSCASIEELPGTSRRASNGGYSTATSCSGNAPAPGPVEEQYVQGNLKCACSGSSSTLGTWMAALSSVHSSSVGRQMSKLCKASSPSAAEMVSCYEREQMASTDKQSQRCVASDFAGIGEVALAADVPTRVTPAVSAATAAETSAAATPQPGSSTSGGPVLRSLVRHLSLPIGKAPASPSATASVAAGSGHTSMRLGRGATSPSCCSSGPPLSAAPAAGSSGAGGSSIAGSGTAPNTEHQQQQPPPAAAIGGQYEFYSLPGQQLHQHLHHKKHEQHPLASLKVMLNQMREASEAIEERQQHAVIIASMASRQQAAIAGKALQALPPGTAAAAAAAGASGAVRSAAAGAARLNRMMSLDSRAHSGAHSNHQLQRQMSAVGAMQHMPYGATTNSCNANGASLQVLQQLQLAHPAVAAGGAAAAAPPTGVPPRPSVDAAAVRHQQQRRRQGRSNNPASSHSCTPSQRPQRLTAELLAVAAAAEARVDEDCYSSKYGSQCGSHGRVRRPSADNLRSSGVGRGTAAGAALRRTAGAVDCGLGMQDACSRKQDSGSSCRVQGTGGTGTAPPCGKANTGDWGQGSALNMNSRQGTTSTSSSGAAGCSLLRTQHWLQQQQQQVQASRPTRSGGVQQTSTCPEQQRKQQQQQHAVNACIDPCHDQRLPFSHTAFAAEAAKASQRTSNSSSASKRRGRNGLVLERLGSKAAALKQMYVLQSNPDAAGELMQSLRAWHAGPEAAAAAKVAARGNSDA